MHGSPRRDGSFACRQKVAFWLSFRQRSDTEPLETSLAIRLGIFRSVLRPDILRLQPQQLSRPRKSLRPLAPPVASLFWISLLETLMENQLCSRRLQFLHHRCRRKDDLTSAGAISCFCGDGRRVLYERELGAAAVGRFTHNRVRPTGNAAAFACRCGDALDRRLDC